MWNEILHFEQVSQMFLCQFCGHVTHPQGNAKTGEGEWEHDRKRNTDTELKGQNSI